MQPPLRCNRGQVAASIIPLNEPEGVKAVGNPGSIRMGPKEFFCDP